MIHTLPIIFITTSLSIQLRVFFFFKTHWVHLCCPRMDMSWCMVSLGGRGGVTPLKNTESCFPRSYQVLIASRLGLGLHGLLPTSILRLLSGLGLCRSSACCHSHYEFLCPTALVCPENSFLEVISYLRLWQSSAPYSQKFLGAWWRCAISMVHLETHKL